MARAGERPGAGAALFDVLVRAAQWSDGLTHPRDALAGPARWRRARTLWVNGSGGEIGRAFYPEREPPEHDAVDSLLVDWRPVLAESAWECLRERVRCELTTTPAEDARTALDVFYVRNRMRKWLGHLPPDDRCAAIYPVFLTPAMITGLLSLPADDRRAGRTFGVALASYRPEVFLAGARTPKLLRLSAAAHLARPYPSDWPLLDALLGHLDIAGYHYRDVFDPVWWAHARAAAGTEPGLRPPLWSLVAAEALSAATAL